MRCRILICFRLSYFVMLATVFQHPVTQKRETEKWRERGRGRGGEREREREREPEREREREKQLTIETGCQTHTLGEMNYFDYMYYLCKQKRFWQSVMWTKINHTILSLACGAVLHETGPWEPKVCVCIFCIFCNGTGMKRSDREKQRLL